ncbi:ALOX5 (predicted) [Pycnogonum litorale]
MGNVAAKFSGEHVVFVKTGNRKGAGTDANVWMIVYDDNGARMPPVKLSSIIMNDHERGDTNRYYLPKVEGFSVISKIEFWRDTFGLADDWFLDYIAIEHRKNNDTVTFPVNRWIKPNKRYSFRCYDCLLPQHDDNQQQRVEEINEKMQIYEYTSNIDGGPVQVKKIPESENFTDEYSWDMKMSATKLKLDARLIGLTSEKWTTLQDLKQIFKLRLDEPNSICRWHDDKWFALQRLQGANPCLIKLCKDIPENFDVSDELLSPFLEHSNLQEVLSNNKLFICDLKIMKNLPCKDDRTICAPIALFYLNKDKDLVPIAIQLFQDKAPDNPVFLPSDPIYTWTLAKMFYNNADSNYHQSVLHIGKSHLMMESFWVCTNRNLSPSHPLFKLLAPHFYFMLAINSLLLEKFMAMGGWMDRVTTCGMRGMCSLIARSFRDWRIDSDFIIPMEIESRGVLDPDVLPNYAYRDDILPTYVAIRNYVDRVVKNHYSSPDDLREDKELRAWRSELIKQRSAGGCNIKGLPGNDVNECFDNLDELIDVLTAVISHCSIFHSAVSFGQYDEYAFPPNYPLSMRGFIIRDKADRTEKDILDQLPNKETTFDVILAMRMLSAKGTNSLGDFEVNYLYDPRDVEAHQQFVAELQSIHEEIQKRNEKRVCSYPWLDPVAVVPNSVAI